MNRDPFERLFTFISLLIALGAPTVGSVAFGVTKDPKQAVLVAVVYSFGVLSFGFFAKIWQKLEDQLVEEVFNWITTRGRITAIIAFKKKYSQYLYYRHRDFDLKGLSTPNAHALALEQVFVELSIVPQPPVKISADIVQSTLEDPNAEQQDIWIYLTGQQFGQHLAILGAPGSGKTTLLKNIVLILASNKRYHKGIRIPNKLPILLFLRNHAETIAQDPDISLAQIIQKSLIYGKLQAPLGWFESRLDKGGCLVMLDGLDEVANIETRRKVVRWVEGQMIIYARNRFIISSRPLGYLTNPVQGVTVLAVRPFTHSQIQRFIHNWYLANEIMSHGKNDQGVRLIADDGAKDLLRRLDANAKLAELAVNPLLLTMIANVHRYRGALPGSRVELYKEICDVFLGKRDMAQGLQLDLNPPQKQRVLRSLAYHMMVKNAREIQLDDILSIINEPLKLVAPSVSPTDFLRDVEERSGLLLERESGEYSFAHLTFQEYLAAAHILEQNLEQDLVKQISESWWHETIRLYSAQTDATAIIEACLTSDNPSVPALSLTIECLMEAREVKPTIREKLENILIRGVEDEDVSRRKLVTEALLSIRQRRMRRINEKTYIDNDLISCAEYQLFLEEKLEDTYHYQPDHWLKHRFSSGKGRSPILGIRPEDAVAFCNWLTERDKGKGNWQYRLPHADEIQEETENQSIPYSYWLETKSKQFILVNRKARVDNYTNSQMSLSNLSDHFLFKPTRRHLKKKYEEVIHQIEREVASNLNIDLSLNRVNDHVNARKQIQQYLSERSLFEGVQVSNIRSELPKFEHINERFYVRIFDYIRGDKLRQILKNTTDRQRIHTLNRIIDLVLTRDLDQIYSAAGNSELSVEQVIYFLFWYIRFMSYQLAIRLINVQSRKSSSSKWRGDNSQIGKDDVQKLIDTYIDLYVAFSILEKRVADNLPAIEGIRIVRERNEKPI